MSRSIPIATHMHPFAYPVAFLWAFAAKCDIVYCEGVPDLEYIFRMIGMPEFGKHTNVEGYRAFYASMNYVDDSDGEYWPPSEIATGILPGLLHYLFMSDEYQEIDPADVMMEYIGDDTTKRSIPRDALIELYNIAGDAYRMNIDAADLEGIGSVTEAMYYYWDRFVRSGKDIPLEILMRDTNIIMTDYILRHVDAQGAAAIEKVRPYIHEIINIPNFIEYLYSIKFYHRTD